MTREDWLNKMAELMAPRFKELGYEFPPFRISIGFTSGGKNSNSDAECWDKSVSKDGRFEMFIRPDQDDPVKVAALVAHEVTHAAVGFKHGHSGDFAKVVLALGLKRPLTSTIPGEAFTQWVTPFIEQLGPLPHAGMKWRGDLGGLIITRLKGGMAGIQQDPDNPITTGPKKQGTRMLKATCAECGYTVRLTKKWLEVGAPHCPNHGAMQPDEAPAEAAEG